MCRPQLVEVHIATVWASAPASLGLQTKQCTQSCNVQAHRNPPHALGPRRHPLARIQSSLCVSELEPPSSQPPTPHLPIGRKHGRRAPSLPSMADEKCRLFRRPKRGALYPYTIPSLCARLSVILALPGSWQQRPPANPRCALPRPHARRSGKRFESYPRVCTHIAAAHVPIRSQCEARRSGGGVFEAVAMLYRTVTCVGTNEANRMSKFNRHPAQPGGARGK